MPELKNGMDQASFLARRAARSYADEEISVTEFGFKIYKRRLFRYPTPGDSWWNTYSDALVDISQYIVKTEQAHVYAATVEHYIATPLQSAEKGLTAIQGIIPNVLVSEETKTLYISEGNHRCAAAAIAGRKILMRLAPLAEAPRFYSRARKAAAVK